MKFQDSSFNGLKVTVGTKSVTHAPTHPLTDAPKAICPICFFKVGGIKSSLFGIADRLTCFAATQFFFSKSEISYFFYHFLPCANSKY